MSSVFRRDRRRFRLLVGAYVLTSAGALGAVLLVWVTVARPPAVVVVDADRRAHLVAHTERPPVIGAYVEAFGRDFATLVAIEDWLTGRQKREEALRMMSVPLANYETSDERAKLEALHQAALAEKKVSGHLLSSETSCRSNASQEWICIVRGEAGYRLGEGRSALVRRSFSVQMHIEELRVTKRSPYGLLVNAFQVMRGSDAAPTQAKAEKEAGAGGTGR